MNSQQSSAKVIITGGTGFLGLNLAHYLSKLDYEVVLISRNKPTQNHGFSHSQWDGRTVDEWAHHLEGADAIINLAGRTVDCIKTPDHCDEILRSRVDSTLAIGAALRQINTPPPVWVQMSTAHIYGDPPTVICDEDSSFGYGLAPFVGQAWEKAFNQSIPKNIRGVILRTSFVLGKEGGALKRMAKLTRLGLGGTVGNGRQGISWIHEEDMNRLFYEAIINKDMKGAYIATAPKPVSNKEFMKALRKALNVPIGLPAPALLASFGAKYLMNTDPELALYGRYCVSKRLMEMGFKFKFPEVGESLLDLYR